MVRPSLSPTNRRISRSCRRSHARSERGLTLVELVMVVLIVAIMSSLVSRNIAPVMSWKRKAEMRKFITTWEFLYDQAIGRGKAYRLVISL